jgi:two-component system, NtrC family, sensor kinase
MKRLILTAGILLFMAVCPSAAFSQSTEFDSVATSIAAMRDDTTKIRAITALAMKFGYQNPERMKALAVEGLRLAERLHDGAGIGQSYWSLGEALWRQDSTVAAARAFQRSLDLYTAAGLPGGRIRPLMSLARLVKAGGSRERAAGYAREGLALSRQFGNPSTEGFFLMELADNAMRKNDTHAAVAYFDTAAEAFTRARNISRIGWCLMQAGQCYGRIEEYRSALRYLERAAAVLAGTNDHYYPTFAYTAIARTYRRLGKLDSAGAALAVASQHADATGQSRFLATVADEAGSLALAKGDTSEAIVQFQKAKDLYSPDVDRESIANAAETMASLFARRLDFQQAYLQLQTSATLTDSVLRSDMRRQLDEVNTRYENEKTEQTISALEKDRAFRDLELARQRDALARERLLAEQRARLFQAERERREVDAARTKAELARKEAETGRQKQALLVLDKERELSRSELRRGTLTRNVSIAGLLVLFIAIGFLAHRYREKKRFTTELESTLHTLQRTQAQLIHSEKMATLGEMTAGIAHEIKNPLNFVTNFSEVSNEMIGDIEQARTEEERAAILGDLKTTLAKIREHGRRADNIVKGMMMHARGAAGELAVLDINVLVDEAVNLAYHGMQATRNASRVTLERRYHPSALMARVIPQEISRVVMNILNNAMYAVQQRAATLEPGTDPPSPGIVLISTAQRPQGVEIRVRDNGSGIPVEIQDKIFQPFFTTKPTGDGTGLGLSMSYDIVVNGHGGTLVCNSDRAGAEFVITLPGENGTKA